MILTGELGLASPEPALPHLTPSEEPVVNVSNEFNQLWICGVDQVHSSLTKDLPTQPVGHGQGHDDQEEGGAAEHRCQPIPRLFEPSRHASGRGSSPRCPSNSGSHGHLLGSPKGTSGSQVHPSSFLSVCILHLLQPHPDAYLRLCVHLPLLSRVYYERK